MTSKQLGSPLLNLISQWSNQPSTSRRSYRMLLQRTLSLQARMQAVEPVENPLVYQRAGLRTPIENAMRDMIGGQAWLLRIIELGCEANCKVVFVQGRSQSTALPSPLKSRVTVIDVSQDPWGWDNDAPESINEGDNLTPSFQDLMKLRGTLQQEIMASEKPVMLVWESLTPLLCVHGLGPTLRFLDSLDANGSGILQVWATRVETLSPREHARLEDACQALVVLSEGEMTLIRQGVRERGNVLRHMLPFQLVLRSGAENYSRYVVDEISAQKQVDKDPATHVAIEEESIKAPDVGSSQVKPRGISTTSDGTSRPKIQLRIEDENEAGRAMSKPSTTTNNTQPHIYLEENDPEFDDMDEEDPDDDLDI